MHPAVAATRVAVRGVLRASVSPTRSVTEAPGDERPLVLVALSGGADSLALAAALAFEAPRREWRAGAVIVDHGLQPDSASVAARAAEHAASLGLSPVIVQRVDVAATADGPEAAARTARYGALERAAQDLGADIVVTGHTRDDQAEQVLLGIARGSGSRSLAGIPPSRGVFRRPLLGISRQETEAACEAQSLTPWRDPHNVDPSYTRVRVRDRILPLLESELGPGIAAALARTAEQMREDAHAFDTMIDEQIEEIVDHAEAGIAISVAALQANPAALRHRLIRKVAEAEFGSELSREHTLAISALVTDWRGQGPIYVPGIRASRSKGRIVLTRQIGSPRTRPPSA